MKIPKIYRQCIYTIASVAWITGILFFFLNHWVLIEGDFGPQKHPIQFWVLKLHGLTSFFAVFGFGVLVSNHIVSAWRANRARKIGLTLTLLVILQIFTGYLLYYLSSDALREWVVNIHFIMGLVYPIALMTHIHQARKKGLVSIKRMPAALQSSPATKPPLKPV